MSKQYILYRMKKDLFGYQTQGINYDIYRPKYPKSMLNKLTNQLKGKKRYLDVATGTGQILFQIYHNFQHSQGLDISKKMLSICQQKIKQKDMKGIVLRTQDFMKAEIKQKYDLITIGQALHWLPIRDFLIKSKNSLEEGGILGVFGYIFDTVEAQNPEQMPQLSKLFQQFYDKKVKKNFDFDRDELHTHYSNKQRYPFQQIFPHVSRQIVKIPIISDKQGFLSYLKTLSGYNTYLQKYKQKQDPISQMQNKIPNDIKIKCTFDYFSVVCHL